MKRLARLLLITIVLLVMTQGGHAAIPGFVYRGFLFDL